MAGQKIIITPVNSVNGPEQMARQVNGNFSKIQNKLNQKSTNIILYDSGHSMAKVFIGKTENGEGAARDGVDAIKALSNSPVSENDFVFNSTIVMRKLAEQERKIKNMESKVSATESAMSSIQSQISIMWNKLFPPTPPNG